MPPARDDDHVVDAAPELPLDSDLATSAPAHLRPELIALVVAGGAVGTAIREGVELLVPAVGRYPLATFAINVAGAFLLGLLLESLARRGPDAGRRRATRLLLGTGALGGFTTYSTLATESAVLLANGGAAIGALYALLTLIAGAGATWLGIAAGARGRRAP